MLSFQTVIHFISSVNYSCLDVVNQQNPRQRPAGSVADLYIITCGYSGCAEVMLALISRFHNRGYGTK